MKKLTCLLLAMLLMLPACALCEEDMPPIPDAVTQALGGLPESLDGVSEADAVAALAQAWWEGEGTLRLFESLWNEGRAALFGRDADVSDWELCYLADPEEELYETLTLQLTQKDGQIQLSLTDPMKETATYILTLWYGDGMRIEARWDASEDRVTAVYAACITLNQDVPGFEYAYQLLQCEYGTGEAPWSCSIRALSRDGVFREWRRTFDGEGACTGNTYAEENW